MPKQIICIGGANVDHKLKSFSKLEISTSNPVKSYTSFGGVARNVAENLARLTNQVYLQCIVGNDADGHQLLLHINQLKVNTDHCIILDSCKTSHYYAVINDEGELYIALSDMNIYNNIDENIFTEKWSHWPDDAIIFADTNLSTSLLQKLIDQCKYTNQRLCIDPVSVTKAKRLPSTLENVFLLKPNRLEASILTNMELKTIQDCLYAGRLLLDRGVQNVVITLGEHGYVIVNKDTRLHILASYNHNINDVNGAGDAFCAGILYGLQNESDIIKACKLGAAAATLTLQTHQSVSQNISVTTL